MAEGDPAVHATASLVVQAAGGERDVDLVPILDPDLHRPPVGAFPAVAHEAPRVSHVPPP